MKNCFLINNIYDPILQIDEEIVKEAAENETMEEQTEMHSKIKMNLCVFKTRYSF